MELMEVYHYLIEKISDPRVAKWPLMASPFPIATVILAYLLFVLYIGPWFMKNRQPYSLNRVMIFYNIFVASASAIVFYGLLTSGFTTKLSWGCEPVDFSYDPEPMSMARWVWWLMILKMCELGDTIIFVLRKKFNQTSFLHIYHHATTVCLAWIACKYAPGGMWTFIMIPNCLVHIIMYTYYLLASLGPHIQKKLAPWKPWITILQLVQFTIMVIHTSQSLLPSCEPTRKPLAFIYMSQVLIMFYLFLDFYKKTYLSKKSE
ncbi:elongation of very long chain fatty acids protein 1-like [Chelonus insularis]|uniref:elongation of very long chain fatty acids protein 1-like n=1 Tax=Chelonus insularis TaxID=460826 RepID=UPI00158A491D|nr:elongation of very long chain fatty acids protein 1-like [Chelonus insularis]XP_034941126.1 elongation of very long chain fatty acids protein 1-like [Chelonus insularis]XP_034941127.1 elongation of very long chain fatty acids protein 1-like [Chelonus insularis]